MVVSVAWAADHLYPGDDALGAKLRQKLYVTNGLEQAPAALERFEAEAPLASVLAAFDRDGAVIIKGVFCADDVGEFKVDHDTRLADLAEHIDSNPAGYTRRPFVDPHYDRKPEWTINPNPVAATQVCVAATMTQTATTRLSKVAAGLESVTKALNSDVITPSAQAGVALTADGQEAPAFDTTGNTDRIIAMGEHRFEFYKDFETGTYAEDSFRYPGPVKPFLAAVLEGNTRSHVGALTTTGQCGDGGWHRDPGSLFDDEKLDLAIPDFYVTMLVPLGATGAHNGATEFILGSHKMTVEECVNADNLRFGA